MSEQKKKINFREIAMDTLSLSPLMSGREQLKTEDLVGQEVTIVAFDFATIEDEDGSKTFPVVLFNEYPAHYYNGGTLLMKLCQAWASECGDVDSASEELRDSGGVKIRFHEGKTKSGRNLTFIDIL